MGVDLYWLREAELKHCRLGMLAAAGTYLKEKEWVGGKEEKERTHIH